MIWFTLLIPFITTLILLYWFRDKTVLWEYAVLWAPSILLIILLNYFMVQYRISDTEYLGDCITQVKYYEDWNEYIHKTCSRTHCTGSGKTRSCHTTYYDCSYVKYHPEMWVMVTSRGYEIEISKSSYNYLVNKFKTKIYFVDMHRHYHTNDGDMYAVDWDGDKFKAHAVTTPNSYDNKIHASHSVFKFEDISEKEIKKWKLYEYPEVDYRYQDCILGYNQNETENNLMYYINGVYGSKYQFRNYILIFKNQPKTAAFKQRSYWEGGNKNEFVICIGIDSLTNEIEWSKSFSWCDVPELATDIDSYIQTQDKLNIKDLEMYLISKTPSEWHRKNFHDFDYLKIEVTGTQLTWIFILVILLNISLSIWIVKNEY